MVLSDRVWSLKSDKNSFLAKNVVLATGAVAKTLHYPTTPNLAFETAIDKQRLENRLIPMKLLQFLVPLIRPLLLSTI